MSVVDIDPKTGLEQMRSSRAIFVIRDSNIDGIPDEFMDKTTPYRSND
jgi:hypothetical protein